MAEDRVSMRVGELYSRGLEYNEAQVQFLSEFSIPNSEENQELFDKAWSDYEHMRFSALQFMKG